MASEETAVVHETMIATSKIGTRLWKNVRGGAYPIGAIKPLLAALFAKAFLKASRMATNIHPLMFGLSCPGSSDLIGLTPVIITPEMVGKTVPIFTVFEVKRATGTINIKEDQQDFVDFVLDNGGIAGVVRSSEEAVNIIHKYRLTQ